MLCQLMHNWKNLIKLSSFLIKIIFYLACIYRFEKISYLSAFFRDESFFTQGMQSIIDIGSMNMRALGDISCSRSAILKKIPKYGTLIFLQTYKFQNLSNLSFLK